MTATKNLICIFVAILFSYKLIQEHFLAASHPNSMPKICYPKLWLLGDSLTQRGFDPRGGCWVSMLADYLARKCDVLNRGFSGYTSKNLKVYFDRLLPDVVDSKVDLGVVLFIGANDANEPSANPLQSVPLHEYTVNSPCIN